MTASVAIVIVSYNAGSFISACLESVLAQRRDVSMHVILVDNASTDDTVTRVRAAFPDVTVLEPGRNLGFAAGVNYGARHADAEFVLLLNPDTRLRERAIDEIVGFARRHPGHGLYGGRTLRADGSLEPSSCWGQPTLWSLAMFALGLTSLFPKNRWLDPESLGDWQRDTMREVGVVTGCFLLTPKTVWDELGGMDERYFMYGEDVDLAMRARAKGYRPLLCPTAELIHEVGSCSETPTHKARMLYRGKASLVRTHWTGLGRWVGLFCLAAGTGLRAALASVSHRRSATRWRTLWRERTTWLKGYTNQTTTS
jgi:GT2 family glycosyltransferase